MEAINEQYFSAVNIMLFIVLYSVVLIFLTVNDILKCGHSNESY